jgi:hypothetical protein
LADDDQDSNYTENPHHRKQELLHPWPHSPDTTGRINTPTSANRTRAESPRQAATMRRPGLTSGVIPDTGPAECHRLESALSP